jgi:hypothetical protein
MMTKQRIGRVELPWANLEPPIRLPDYYINLEKRKAKKEAAIKLGHTDSEKSRRGRSVDLGTVRPPHTPTLAHHVCCMLPIGTPLTKTSRLPYLLAKS